MSEEVKEKPTKAKDKDKGLSIEEAKRKTLSVALANIEKVHGKGSVLNMAERPTVDVAAIPSGSIGLDVALGVGGYPPWSYHPRSMAPSPQVRPR